MSEGFRITGPGRYALRGDESNWGPAIITGPSNEGGYAWQGYFGGVNGPRKYKATWTDEGAFNRHAARDVNDIVARLPDEPPMPDAQDRIPGVETTPKPVDPLTRLESWIAKGIFSRRCEIKASKVYLHEDEHLTIITSTCSWSPTIVDTINRALDIAEGVTP